MPFNKVIILHFICASSILVSSYSTERTTKPISPILTYEGEGGKWLNINGSDSNRNGIADHLENLEMYDVDEEEPFLLGKVVDETYRPPSMNMKPDGGLRNLLWILFGGAFMVLVFFVIIIVIAVRKYISVKKKRQKYTLNATQQQEQIA